jgi:hypothetical protein
MLYLTKHEKAVLIVLAIVMTCGSCLNMAFKKYSGLTRWIEEKEHFLHKTDVNAASFDELVRVPYIGDKSAHKIIEHRQTFGPIGSLQELGLITHLSPASLEKAGKYLRL